MHPQNLLCPITYTYVPFTPELKAKIVEKQFLQLNEDAEPVENNNINELVEYLTNFKLIYQRDKFLTMGGITPSMGEKFQTQLISIHKLMGDTLFKNFIFEFL